PGRARRAHDLVRPEHDHAVLLAQPRARPRAGRGGRGRHHAARPRGPPTRPRHEATRGPWIGLRERGVNVKEVRLRPDGRLDYEDMAAKVGPRTHVVAMGLSSNALGTVNDAAVARALSRAVGAILVL